MPPHTTTPRVHQASPRRTLALASLAHGLHDGCTDLVYVLLPIWQTEFALSYGLLALLRGLYSGTMAGLQIFAGTLARRWGLPRVLAAGTALTAAGYALAGLSAGLLGLCVALMLCGVGASTQHPLASTAVTRAYGDKTRGPLGIYNFGGDLGKAALPAAVSLLLVVLPWRHALGCVAALGLFIAVFIALLLPRTASADSASTKQTTHAGHARGGFALLLGIGILDSATRMGFLTFLPFLLKDKGATLPAIGFGLALVFIGGAVGKFICGWLGERLGILWTVLATEGGTAVAILLVLALPLTPALCVLPLLGLMLNGTSSVLYGTVPELTTNDKVERAFSVFYTGTIGAGALAPVLYGLLGDAMGAHGASVATALTALATLPLAVLLTRRLAMPRPV